MQPIRQALNTAYWLESVANLDFVLAPMPDRFGGIVVQFAESSFALSIYPWIDAEPISDPDGSRTAHVVAELHAVTPRLRRIWSESKTS